MKKVKSQDKKTRETRVAYRAKRKPQTAKSRARKLVAAKVVPWEKRLAPTDGQIREWTDWLNQHEPEFEAKYPGHYLAIWDKEIIATTSNRDQIYSLADAARPEVIPLITYVPRANDMNFAFSPFPAEWSKK